MVEALNSSLRFTLADPMIIILYYIYCRFVSNIEIVLFTAAAHTSEVCT